MCHFFWLSARQQSRDSRSSAVNRRESCLSVLDEYRCVLDQEVFGVSANALDDGVVR
jgi:hypothetical protein